VLGGDYSRSSGKMKMEDEMDIQVLVGCATKHSETAEIAKNNVKRKRVCKKWGVLL